ncbi:hypothetical protein UFOVP53_78 [uncultured Caudovirales phage]|uniref:Uncharacterized protein n=1 Tax=uncultured Caudovirales phage TaxID=2100421 RepID=A0A6J5KVI1_9CAUD|nr:hypothetical protein UFOVP53_78 [uncultured Caudovirales phage]
MAANKASLEKVLQSSLKNKRAGTEVATSIVGVEALLVSGIAETVVVENSDPKFVGRCRATICHKAYGKRLADAVSTLDSIIVAEGLVVVAADKDIQPSRDKQKLRKVCIDEMARKDVGTAVADMVSKSEQAVDQLMVIYAANAPVLAALTAIKAILAS